ncbi:TRAM domain-containing protein [Candidatus Saccharibacteria bacterium]|jgi:uncharacterized protein YacL|nr:TRAM domain-containing protein [Candidatus Saccharibacteria bacterium]
MTTENTIILAILLVILIETSYLLYIMQKKQLRNNNTAVYVDTSVLMDGRVLPIAETGFITAELVIPRSVIGELQLLADGSDHDKRARARFGLDVAQKLRECESVTVTLLQDGSVAREGVDERLLNLAKKSGGMICTIDYNLNKVAQVEGIGVLNINELAKNVRLSHLPGETINLELTQKGQDSHQGVGYLEDGTMVVVENSSKHIGKKIDIEIIRALQTDAGRMMFAKAVDSGSTNLLGKTKSQPSGRRQAQGRSISKPKTDIKTKSLPKPKKSVNSKADKTKKPKPTGRPRKQSSLKRSMEDDLLNLVENQRD